MEPIVYILDAQPIVGALRQEAVRADLEALLYRATEGELELRLTTVNAGEVLYGVERALGPAAAHEALRILQEWPIDIVAVDLELAGRAAWLKLRGGISYADCFAAALAHRDGGTVATGDIEFRRVEDVVPVLWLGDRG